MSKYLDATEVEFEEIAAEARTEISTEEKPKIYNITKEDIERILVDNGFNKIDNDHYRKTEEIIKQRMIVNGQDISKKETIHIDIELIGEGYIENSENFLMTQGISLRVQEDAVSDFWISCKDDLSFYMNLK